MEVLVEKHLLHCQRRVGGRGEVTLSDRGGLKQEGQKAGEYKNQLLVLSGFFQVKSCFKIFGSM